MPPFAFETSRAGGRGVPGTMHYADCCCCWVYTYTRVPHEWYALSKAVFVLDLARSVCGPFERIVSFEGRPCNKQETLDVSYS